MSSLKIIKKTSKVWLHEPSDFDNFILSQFYCKSNNDLFKIFEFNGVQRGEYNYSDVIVQVGTGIEETFASIEALMLRLEVLKYPGFSFDEADVIAGIISSDPSNALEYGTDGGLFVPEVEFENNHIIVANGFSLAGQDLTINADWNWEINNTVYVNPADVVLNIPFASSGMQRIDRIVANTSNTFQRIAGFESVSNPVATPEPDNTITISFLTVTDGTIDDPTPPITGDAFIKKMEKQQVIDSSTGAIDFSFSDERATAVFTGAVTVLQSTDLDSMTIYENKKYTFKNHQLTPITIEHLSGTGSGVYKFSFPNETDFILYPNETIEFLGIKDPIPVLEYVGKLTYEIDNVNGLQDALDDKLDTSAYNDRFKGKYTSLVNLQTAYPTANDGDYAIVDVGPGTDALEYIWDTNEGWVKGNSTGATTTDALPEGSLNLYFQTARVLSTALTGISFATGGAIVSTDTVLQAFGKIQNQITAILTDTSIGSFINGLTGKTTPVDSDYSIIMDSADSNKAKKLSWANIKATLKTYFDVFYAPKKFRISSTVDTITITGDTASHILVSSVLIPAGSVKTGDVAVFRCRPIRTLTVSGSSGVALAIHPTSGITTIAGNLDGIYKYSNPVMTTTNLCMQHKSEIVIKNQTNLSELINTAVFDDDSQGTNAPLLKTNTDWTIDQYLYIYGNNAQATTSLYLSMWEFFTK